MKTRGIRVLHLGLSPNRGGIESVVHSWWKALDGLDVSFDFANVYHEPIAFEEEFVAAGSRVLYLPARKDGLGKHNAELRRIIAEGGYDFVHCHVMSLSEPEPVAICDELGLSTQVIIHSHTVASPDTMSLRRRLIHLYGRAVLRKHDYLRIACGQKAGRAMFGSDDFKVIENGIDIEAFRFSEEKRRQFRRAYGIPEDAFVIGHVGRPDKAKNYPFIIEVFSKVLCIRSNAVLLLVGDVKGDASIQASIDRFGIREHCVMTGKLSSTEECYSAMDVFLFPSLYEGFSVSVIEAQASGLVCTLSDRVSREHAVSSLVRFMPISDSAPMVRAICADDICCLESRATVTLDDRHDARVIAEKMLIYYRDHLTKKNRS